MKRVAFVCELLGIILLSCAYSAADAAREALRASQRYFQIRSLEKQYRR